MNRRFAETAVGAVVLAEVGAEPALPFVNLLHSSLPGRE